MAAPRPRPGAGRAQVVLRATAGAALAVSSYVHVGLADGPLAADGQVTLAGLFLAQAVVAGLVALWLLVRGDRWSWLAAALVGAASLAALVLSVYVRIPSVGPLPVLYEPVWYAEKVVAAVAAAVATAASVVVLAMTRRLR